MASYAELKAFHLVAEVGSFSQAAREGGITQSTLSTQVRNLEQGANLRLFERLARGVRLTRAGEDLQQATRRLFEAEDDARHILSRPRQRSAGLLRVCSDGAVLPVIVLQELRKSRPEVQFTLEVTNSQGVLEALTTHRADVGIAANIVQDSRFHAQPFLLSRLVALVAREHDFATRETLSLAELNRQPLVLRETGSQTRAVLEANLRAHHLLLNSTTEVRQQEALREVVASGLAVGVGIAEESQQDTRIRTVPLSDCEIALQEYILTLADRPRSPLIRQFTAAALAVNWQAI